jgi:thymidylate synthase (FAD)
LFKDRGPVPTTGPHKRRNKMILLRPSHKILRITEKAEELIELAGRLCYKSEGKIGDGTAKEFIRKRIKAGHESIIEHAVITVKFITDTGVTHEEVRHRLASYSQESTRYCNYHGGISFIIPPWVDIPEGDYPLGTKYPLPHNSGEYWYMAMMDAERYYETLLNHSWTPQMARDVLPKSLKTEIIHTSNLREWRHILNLRTSKAAHPQMRELMIPLLRELKEKLPVFFEDIVE